MEDIPIGIHATLPNSIVVPEGRESILSRIYSAHPSATTERRRGGQTVELGGMTQIVALPPWRTTGTE